MKNIVMLFGGILLMQAHAGAQMLKQDSVQSFNNDVVKNGVLKSIKESGNDFEMRVYARPSFYSANFSRVIIISVRNGAASAQSLDHFYIMSRSIELEQKGYKLATINKSGYVYIRTNKLHTTPAAIKKAIDESKILFSADETELLDSLRQQQVPLVDPCMGSTDCIAGLELVEIKSKNEFRNLRIIDLDYYPKNSSIQRFYTSHIIYTFFDQLLNTKR
jgi:hypothetical protein